MVLEEAYADDISPASAPDPYDSSPSSQKYQPQSYEIDTRQLPRAMPLLGPLFGYTHERLRNAISRNVAGTATLIRRPLTPDEVTAVSYHVAKTHAITSYGGPIGVAAGLWRERKTRTEFRFPFYKPSAESFNPQNFLGAIKGPQAEAAWNALRRVAWGTWAGAVGFLLMATYGSTVGAVGERQDPRMKDVVAAIQKLQKEEWKGKDAKQIREATRRAFEEGNRMQMDRNAAADAGVAGARQQETHTRQEVSSDYDPQQSQASPTDYFDDASPTASSEPVESVTPGGGSAWDRIRKGGGPLNRPARPLQKRNAPSRPQPRSEAQNDGSSFGFSGTEAERQRAMNEAQKEFDARVDRERRGKDFDDENGRWR